MLMAGRKRAPYLAGYPEEKHRRQGASYWVYVQPFWVEHVGVNGSVWVKRKCQSRAYDTKNGASGKQAIAEAASRAASQCQRLSGTADLRTTEERLPTLRSISSEYLKQITSYDSSGNPRGAKPATHKEFKKNIKRAASTKPSIADIPLNQLSRELFNKHFYTFVHGDENGDGSTVGHAATTAEKYRTHLSSLGRFAVEREYWTANLFAASKSLQKVTASLKKISPENQVLELSEIGRIHEAALKFSPQMHLAILLLRLGLRATEMLGVTEDCVDFENYEINIKYTLSQGHSGWARDRESLVYLEDPKTHASNFRVPVPKLVLDAVKESLKKSAAYPVPAFDDRGETKDRRFIVCNKQGHAWRYDNFLRVLIKLYSLAGVDLGSKGGDAEHRNNRWVHIWRKTYASELVALNADDMTLQRLMRHSDVHTSKQVYASARANNYDTYKEYSKEIQQIEDYNAYILQIDVEIAGGVSPFMQKVIGRLQPCPLQQAYHFRDKEKERT